jgi:hypothetical protein
MNKYNKELFDNLIKKDKIAENLGRLNKDVDIYYYNNYNKNLSFSMTNILITGL